MRTGGMAPVCLADVPDGPLLGRRPDGVLAALRSASPGELYRYHLDRLTWMDEMVAKHGVRRALTVADLKAAHAAGQPVIIEDIEGLDFLERKLERPCARSRGDRRLHRRVAFLSEPRQLVPAGVPQHRFSGEARDSKWPIVPFHRREVRSSG